MGRACRCSIGGRALLCLSTEATRLGARDKTTAALQHRAAASLAAYLNTRYLPISEAGSTVYRGHCAVQVSQLDPSARKKEKSASTSIDPTSSTQRTAAAKAFGQTPQAAVKHTITTFQPFNDARTCPLAAGERQRAARRGTGGNSVTQIAGTKGQAHAERRCSTCSRFDSGLECTVPVPHSRPIHLRLLKHLPPNLIAYKTTTGRTPSRRIPRSVNQRAAASPTLPLSPFQETDRQTHRRRAGWDPNERAHQNPCFPSFWLQDRGPLPASPAQNSTGPVLQTRTPARQHRPPPSIPPICVAALPIANAISFRPARAPVNR